MHGVGAHVFPAAATGWGALAGLVLPRAVHRLSVPPGEPWRPGLRPGARGWLGPGPGRRATAVTTALTAAGCGAVAQVAGVRPESAVWLLLVPLGVLLARVDLAVHRLPDVLTLPAAAGTAALLGVAALLPGHAGSWPRALLGGALLGAGYLVLLAVNPGGMGWGDVKLAPTCGMALAWYGWPALVGGVCLGFGLGAVVALGLLLTGRAGRRSAVSFGPFMLLGTLGGVLLAR
ncbi:MULTISPECIES: prepilin peptidase [Streptomycetaceae]|uniref:Peptidase A24A prepilin type IV n=1 Tax=Streptantibioticus cattleyicolor (strain ATCC 35852 / DSM 46488 / JCM 4925 / NBRC 14057 / NRRL 8057) TaxID=1003195 RepID=F8K2F6_STREN|nr:A24 family peptidase [Streptantibioticus cattleyicolor]AEW96248.1 peptidase A24A prepilin type IV [Streptantibioticus cattleyicolor NRRL 8057 = DSM 46488]MYS60768.1 prepilin peptidase [Streptomyces sp. SID5468]CCB76587.1 conserved membrane protein of unknown function [Streptantibioticus cattleyicolor NRRL 8057 = DSM 46488]